MRISLRSSLLSSLCVGLLLLFGSGCGMAPPLLTDSAPEAPEPEPVPKDTIFVATADTTEMRPEVARLYTLEARLLSTEDSVRTAQLLNRAMSELSEFLQSNPQALEADVVRRVYSGLTAEYRRFHGYESTPDSLQMARGRIFAVRARLFSSLEEVENPLLEAPPPAGAEVEGTEIPMTMNRLVNRSMSSLLEEPEDHVNRWLKRVQVYGPMIEHILAEEEVPSELKYLAMIESGLNPNARSWAGAVGMWQFMESTGRLYDLSVNAWVDERRDPEKATRAAARHLRDLYEEFGAWHLALAGYNCGEGCVKRALRRSDEENPSYWDVYESLPRETRGYVPLFIAAARIMENPDAFDLAPAEPTSAFAYDYVPVHGSMLSLGTVARLADTTRSAIEFLNPELRRTRVPPSKERYYLRIPLGNYPRFAWNYAALPDEQKRPASTYRVRQGDTLSEIAQQFGTSTTMLQRLNGLQGSLIREGQQLVVPVQSYSSALADNSESTQPMRVQYGTSPPARPLDRINTAQAPPSNSTPSSAARSSTSTSNATPSPTTYQVTRGDTLRAIAQRFNVTVGQIQSWNDLSSSRIYPGQRLRIVQ